MAVEETRRRIIRAFRILAVQNGIKGTTTRKIAEQADLNEGTIFRYFKTKQEIIDTVVAEGHESIERLGTNFQSEGDFVGDMKAVASLFCQYINEHPEIIVLGNEASNSSDSKSVSQLDALIDNFYDLAFNVIQQNGYHLAVDAHMFVQNFVYLCLGYVDVALLDENGFDDQTFIDSVGELTQQFVSK